jgi:hypothetical protein
MSKPAETASAVDERARLLEKKRKAQEELDKIKEEEERLERLEAGKRKDVDDEKKRDDERKKLREEERRKEDELRKPAFGDRRRDDDRDRDRDRRPEIYDRGRRDDDRRRDGDSWPPRISRESSGIPPRPRVRNISPSSINLTIKSPIGASTYRPRPMSPPPLASRLEPYGRRSPPPRRMLSPPPIRGDSYRPDPRDSGPPALTPRDLAQKFGLPPRDRDRTFAEPMSSYPVSPTLLNQTGVTNS